MQARQALIPAILAQFINLLFFWTYHPESSIWMSTTIKMISEMMHFMCLCVFLYALHPNVYVHALYCFMRYNISTSRIGFTLFLIMALIHWILFEATEIPWCARVLRHWIIPNADGFFCFSTLPLFAVVQLQTDCQCFVDSQSILGYLQTHNFYSDNNALLLLEILAIRTPQTSLFKNNKVQ